MFYFFPLFFLFFSSLSNNKKLSFIFLFLLWIFFLLFIGLRTEVGADWTTYARYCLDVQFMTFEQIERRFDNPLYVFILYIVGLTKTGIYGFNFINALIFSTGLIYFCNNLKNPLLGLISAYPYLIVVVSMGFVVQASAIGFLLIGLVNYEKKNHLIFYISLFMGYLLHPSSLLFLLIPVIDNLLKYKKKRNFFFLTILLLISIIFSNIILYVFKRYEYFFTTEYSAAGAYIVSTIAIFFSILFFNKRSRFIFNSDRDNLVMLLALCSLFFGIVTFFTNSTTASYRIGLYFMPLQIYILANLPYTGILNFSFKSWKILIFIYSFCILFGWLAFANYSYAWIEYNNLLFPIRFPNYYNS